MKKQTKKKTNESGFTTVKTGYARAVLLLLACNLCLTTYAFIRLNNYSDEMISSVTGSPVDDAKEVVASTD